MNINQSIKILKINNMAVKDSIILFCLLINMAVNAQNVNSLLPEEIKTGHRQNETSIFDKAVKSRIREWNGYLHFLDLSMAERDAILKKIDTLDLSGYDLTTLPQEIKDCIYLKSLNLLKNNFANWDSVFLKISLLKQLSDFKITINLADFNKLKPDYQKLITGIEIIAPNLNQIPDNIIDQNQLTYLDFNGFQNEATLKDLSPLFRLKGLNISIYHTVIFPLYRLKSVI
jgi:hypothetical protein